MTSPNFLGGGSGQTCAARTRSGHATRRGIVTTPSTQLEGRKRTPRPRRLAEDVRVPRAGRLWIKGRRPRIAVDRHAALPRERQTNLILTVEARGFFAHDPRVPLTTRLARVVDDMTA